MLLSLSEQQIVDCAKDAYDNPGTGGCEGGDAGKAFLYSSQDGVMTWESYPYIAQDQNCSYNMSEVILANSSFSNETAYVNVTANKTADLKEAIASGPVAVAIEADTIPFQFYGGGIFNSPTCGTELDHAVVAIGYGADSKGREYYIVRNSWGPDWGVEGYIRIAIVGDGPGICGIQMYAQYPVFM